MNPGIKSIVLSDEDIAAFYENRYKVEMCENQYLFIKNEKDEVIDKFKYSNGELVPLKYRNIDSPRFGKVKPINDEQYALFDLLQDETITVKQITGVAGSGKNYTAFTYALDAIDRGKSPYRKIVMVRNNIEVKDSNSIGALPSGINEKLLPFAMPAVDLLGSTIELFRLIDDGKLELLHLGFARGRSFENTIIIVDEAANITIEHAALLISRVGKNSVIIFLGDLRQSDRAIFEKNSGLARMNERLSGNKLYGSVFLSKSERSPTACLAELMY